ncbi:MULTISPECIES: cytochrome c [unclassified Pseudomonas]|uniref:c-type cytochrome n=1 Tax=unclassified Pseudomonas TaxID=196821 RepID=UPI000EA83CD7|nr:MULTISPECIES: cytochrome c [unclassified Pseudomonas]AYF87224.1 cytochrome c [Pseudomonas sp. DY-1]MDH4651433.1 cytochrome c [Pseudomonas sp. BN606]MRK23265.1 cytochrome c [Pseudomonas sp. JG-B]
MRHALLALLFCFTPLHAAELTLEMPGGTRTWDTAALLAHPQAQEVTIVDDVSYKKSMRYRAVPLSALLEGVKPDEHLQAVALDGFAAELAAAPLLNSKGARAWLAIEDPAKPWPPLAAGKPSAGPFYLVWTNPKAARIGPEQWPFQVARIRYLPSVAERFPALLPADNADAGVQAGFDQFQKNCLACHRLNGAGDAQFGPDLNIPHNPTEYLAGDFLPRYIRDPQSLRRWPQGRMPGFSKEAITDEELGQLIGYLKHMAGRKVAP